jgi:DNA-binding Lrp family transcriptional regulator
MFFLRLPLEQKERSPKKMIEFSEVMQADVVFGEYDVIARMTTTDLEKLQDFVSDKVRTYITFL